VRAGVLRAHLSALLRRVLDCSQPRASELADEFMVQLPGVYERLLEDVAAALAFDPAAESLEEVITSYPGFHAIAIYRLAHELHHLNVPLLQRAMQAVHDVTAAGGRVLFVGTKRQAQDLVKEYAERCGQYYVNHRWLGGTLTNWKTVSHSIKRLKDLEERLGNEQATAGLTKKEQLMGARDLEKLNRSLGGIKDMNNIPDAIFVVDVGYQKIAVAEAKKLGVPVIGVVDTNNTPEGVDYVIPGNDDAARAIRLYARAIADAVLEGKSQVMEEIVAAGQDEYVEVEEAAPAACLILAANQTTLAVNRSFHAWFGPGADQIVRRPVLRDFRFKARRSLDDIWSGFYQGRMDEEPARMINFAPGRVLAANVTLSPVNLPGKARFACLVWLHK